MRAARSEYFYPLDRREYYVMLVGHVFEHFEVPGHSSRRGEGAEAQSMRFS